MTKVECLRRLLIKLAGNDSSMTSADDTVCKLLHKIGDYVEPIGKSNISSTLTGSVNEDKYTGTIGVICEKSNANYQLIGNINITAKATGDVLGKTATITLPEGLRDFQSQYAAAYYSIKSGETTTYNFMHVGLSHVRGEATAEVHILDHIQVNANDVIMFAAQFNFIA